MKALELVNQLLAITEQHGDVPVMAVSPSDVRQGAVVLADTIKAEADFLIGHGLAVRLEIRWKEVRLDGKPWRARGCGKEAENDK
jgi:hypothetical protein